MKRNRCRSRRPCLLLAADGVAVALYCLTHKCESFSHYSKNIKLQPKRNRQVAHLSEIKEMTGQTQNQNCMSLSPRTLPPNQNGNCLAVSLSALPTIGIV